MKFSWEDLFQTVVYIAGFAAVAFVIAFFFYTVRGCDAVTEQQRTARQATKAKVYQTCIDKGNAPLECRETLKDLY
jgi:hypothetical protein